MLTIARGLEAQYQREKMAVVLHAGSDQKFFSSLVGMLAFVPAAFTSTVITRASGCSGIKPLHFVLL